jgi:hypothetical protein
METCVNMTLGNACTVLYYTTARVERPTGVTVTTVLMCIAYAMRMIVDRHPPHASAALLGYGVWILASGLRFHLVLLARCQLGESFSNDRLTCHCC